MCCIITYDYEMIMLLFLFPVLKSKEKTGSRRKAYETQKSTGGF